MSSQGRYRQRLSAFAANGRVLALRGLVALLFGLAILFWPGLILAVLTLFPAIPRKRPKAPFRGNRLTLTCA